MNLADKKWSAEKPETVSANVTSTSSPEFLSNKPPHLNKILFATVFITGAAVLILEITAVRILSPFYGSSLHVLSSVLTVILGALSLGYWYGGKRADREHSLESLYTIIAISGVSVLFLLVLANKVLPILGPHLSTTAGPLVFSLGLFFIPAFLLGIVSPYIIKIQSLATPSEKIGSVVGGTFFWGTFGSIVGSLATGFTFIPHLGVTYTVLLVSLSLIVIGLITPFILKRSLSKVKISVMIFVAVALSIFIFAEPKSQENLVYEKEGVYSNIKIKDLVSDNQPARILFRDTNQSAAIYKNSKALVFPNLRFSLLHKKLIPNAKRILILGGGAYTAPRTLLHYDPELKIDVVEIEAELYPLAKKYFDLGDTTNLTNHIMDARVFLNQYQGEKYDLIFVDVFSTNLAPPFHLTTKEFYQDLSKHLNPEGVVMLNTVGSIDGTSPSISGSLAKTLQEVFPTVVSYGLAENRSELQNVMFLARLGNTPIEISTLELRGIVGYASLIPLTDFNLENELVLTDDRAPVEYLMAKLQ